MRRRLLLGNWKMFKGPTDSRALAKALAEKFGAGSKPDTVVVFPPALSLSTVHEALGSTIALGAQNVHWEKEGAFTGENSAVHAADAGATYVLVGHSERRTYFGETDETANRRVKAVLAAGLTPVLCVGETLAERDANTTEDVVKRQMLGGLGGLDAQAAARLVIAYEPVWAIGTGRVATPEQAQAVHTYIRQQLRLAYGTLADNLSIVYGGSVKADNAASLMSQNDIDGALVGGASLDANVFFAIGQAF